MKVILQSLSDSERYANHRLSSRSLPEEPREVDQLSLRENTSKYNVTLGDFAVGNILTQKRVRNRAVEHVCKCAGPTKQRKAREPFHKTVCVGVQWIESRSRVVQMMSFWDFENSVKDSEGGHFSRRVAAVTTRWRRRTGSSGQLGRASNRQCGGVKFLVAYRNVWCFSTMQFLRVRLWARWLSCD